MNLQENNIIKTILRRLPSETLDKMDDEFKSSLNYVSSVFLRDLKGRSELLPEKEFKREVIVDLITLLELEYYLPEDVDWFEWYEDAVKFLTKQYDKRMSSMYRTLKTD